MFIYMSTCIYMGMQCWEQFGAASRIQYTALGARRGTGLACGVAFWGHSIAFWGCGIGFGEHGGGFGDAALCSVGFGGHSSGLGDAALGLGDTAVGLKLT